MNNNDNPMAIPTCSSFTISVTDGKKRPSQPLPEQPAKKAKKNRIAREGSILFKKRLKTKLVKRNKNPKIKKALIRSKFKKM